MGLWRADSANIAAGAVTASKLGYASDAVVVVQRGSTDVLSAANLKTAYTAAKALTPGGAALSKSNRAALLIPPGGYDFGSGEEDGLLVDGNFVDPISLAPASGRIRRHTSMDYMPGATGLGVTQAVADADFDPPPTVLYGTNRTVNAGWAEKGYVVRQTAADVKMKGFAIANLSVSTAYNDNRPAFGLLISVDGNKPSVYDQMYFWCSLPYVSYGSSGWRSPVYSIHDMGGLWRDCISNAFGYRVKSGTPNVHGLSARMFRCTGGVRSFGGDEILVDINGELYDCECIGRYWKNTTDIAPSGEGSFGGCEKFGCVISGRLERCRSGRFSYALGVTFSGIAIDCVGEEDCFAGYCGTDVNYGTFSGQAIRCTAKRRSFGGGHASSKMTGKLIDCECDGMPATMVVDGGTIERSRLQSTTPDINLITIANSALIANQTDGRTPGGAHTSNIVLPITGTGLGGGTYVAAVIADNWALCSNRLMVLTNGASVVIAKTSLWPGNWMRIPYASVAYFAEIESVWNDGTLTWVWMKDVFRTGLAQTAMTYVLGTPIAGTSYSYHHPVNAGFRIGAYAKDTVDGTYHRINSYSTAVWTSWSSPYLVTTFVVSPAAGTEWDGRTDIRAYGFPTLHDSTLLVAQAGAGVPVYAAAAVSAAVSHCRMNNATADADGLHANVTNLVGTPANVIDDEEGF